MLIASFNVQNLFERATALSAEAGSAGAKAVEAQAEINGLLRKPDYDDDRERIGELLVELGLEQSDEGSGFTTLRRNRGKLLKRPQSDGPEVVAKGRRTGSAGSSSRPSRPTSFRPATRRA